MKGGLIIDGTGASPYPADLAVKGQKIADIGNLEFASAKRVLDIGTLVVAPGFIDTHVHTDAALLNHPQHQSAIQMGVTTEVLGQDGLSYAPLNPENYRSYSEYMSGLCGMPPPELDMSSIS
ncbi:uncharacterized protein METZ01_LOCUS265642, partial [marine metagenome]